MTLLPTTHKDVRGYQDEAGKFYPSSGAILDLLFPSQMQWIDEKYLEEGNRCHAEMRMALLHKRNMGEWPTEFASPRVKALVEHLATWNFEPVEAEQPRCSPMYGHAGTPDALLMRGDLYVIGDWKFAQAMDERYLFQVESYRKLYEQNVSMILFQVDKDAKVKPVSVKPSARRWTLFLNALAVMKFRLQ